EPAGPQLLHLAVDPCTELAFVGEDRGAAPAADEDLAGVRNDELRTALACKLERVRECMRGGVGAVGGPENRLEHVVLLSVDPSFRPAGVLGIGVGPDAGRGFPTTSRYARAMDAVTPSDGRLRSLLEASVAITSDLSL